MTSRESSEMVALADELDSKRHLDCFDEAPIFCTPRQRDLIVQALRTAARPDAGYAVKALEWRMRDSDTLTVDANTSIGHYVAFLAEDGCGTWFVVGQTTSNLVIGGIDAAKAAAQADYETRIRSALLGQPATHVAGFGNGLKAEIADLVKRLRWPRGLSSPDDHPINTKLRVEAADMLERLSAQPAPAPAEEEVTTQPLSDLPKWQLTNLFNIIKKLTKWREEDHEDTTVLWRSDICALLDAFAHIAAKAKEGK